jgi:maltooligosyltrehalose trehalohydrolase
VTAVADLDYSLPLGASRTGATEWTFNVWAPRSERVLLRIEDADDRHDIELDPDRFGYHVKLVDGLAGEPTYRFVLDDGKAYADPASRRQPHGVHGPSQAVDLSSFEWHDGDFAPPAPEDLVIYELHVGAFTAAGTFDAATDQLDELARIGINAVEVMPIAAFPGTRNWGYDGVFPFAVQESYGGAAGFQRFVDACHKRGLAVLLDVVYNHLGPEGSVHASFAPYLTDRYATPWGAAINFSEHASDEVRRYFTDNALMWLRDFHVDGLRFDAIHGIVDPTASPFLREATQAISALSERIGKPLITIAESGDNNPLVTADPSSGGLGFHQQWNDDFHHALHAALTGERNGYYQDFGSLHQVATAYTHGFVFRGEYSAFRGRRHGSAIPRVPSDRLVVFAQNHDQVGNRADAARLAALVGERRSRLAIAATLLSPFVPLLFMGEEHAATTPFPYFVDHGDPELLEAVRRGRAAEFGREADRFDPGAPETLASARLQREGAADGAETRTLVSRLLEVRKTLPLLRDPEVDESVGYVDAEVVVVHRRRDSARAAVALNFSDAERVVELPEAPWELAIDSDCTLSDYRLTLAPFGFGVCSATA